MEYAHNTYGTPTCFLPSVCNSRVGITALECTLCYSNWHHLEACVVRRLQQDVCETISDTFGMCKYMLPINCTDPANEDVIISASEWELYRSLHNIAVQMRLSEWTIVEVLCDYELHCNATHGMHICTRCFSPLDVMLMNSRYAVLWGHIQHPQLSSLGME